MVGLNLLFRRKIFHFSSDKLWLSAAADMGVVAGYKFSVVINLRNLLKICSYFGCENKKYSGINNVI